MQTITIDGKTYQLVPVNPFGPHGETVLDISLSRAEEKADLYRSKYRDYKNIPRQELISRIIKIDQMTEWEYCKHTFETWVNWEELYKAVSTQMICPYKSLQHFKDTGMNLVKEVFENKRSIATGYFRVVYNEGYTNEEGIYELPEINLDVEIYGTSHTIGDENRDYLEPEDDQTYNDAG